MRQITWKYWAFFAIIGLALLTGSCASTCPPGKDCIGSFALGAGIGGLVF